MASSMKQLVVFGDSWPYGAELDDVSFAFPYIIGNLINTTVFNASVPATSVDHACHRFLNDFKNVNPDTYDWYDKSGETEYMFLFCITSAVRSMHIKNGELMELHPLRKDIESKSYYANIYSDELAEFNLIRNIIAIQALCKQMRVPAYFVSNWEPMPKHPLIDYTYVYSKSLIEILGEQNFSEIDGANTYRKSKYVMPNDMHPNVEGHRVIGEELAKWINSI